MIIRNWRDMEPRVRKQAALEWIIMLANDANRKDGLASHDYISRVWIQPGMILEPDEHQNEEEVFYIVSGIGRALVSEKSYALKNGNIVYIPAGETYQVLNDGCEPLELVAFGAKVEKEGLEDRGIVIKNWRDAKPWMLVKVHGYGIDWRILSKRSMLDAAAPKSKVFLESGEEFVSKTIPPKQDRDSFCLRTLNFFAYAQLQPGKSYEAHGHQAEEIYYIIKGKGKIRGIKEDNSWEDFPLGPGDVCVTPVGEKHKLINDGDEFIEFIAWGSQRK